tara:strand:- start:1292 stop:2689 length:1398 start_codon:yes stop_codon:yes gene_type:complete
MKLGVCVPYRNREEHLHQFIPRVGKHLKEAGIDFQMYFAHQVDDKLFNRGAMKNIAAKHAFEEGCDYVVWHDIDMIPEEGVDYSFPEDYPIHLATRISQMEYGLKYHEYFGGAVLFSKEQVEKTNGYSNDYWDWGMEDDDLFWRCHLEGLTNDSFLDIPFKKKKLIKFNGDSSWAKIKRSKEIKDFSSNSHTISVLCRAYQQPDKVAIHLIGDKDKTYVEFPIVRIPGYDYGVSFNNSRALSFQYWNNFNQLNYMWLKRYDGQWSWVTVVVNQDTSLSHFYLNGTEVDSKAGFGSESPWQFHGHLKKYGNKDIYLGVSPKDKEEHPAKYFKGDIADIKIWNYALTKNEVINLHNEYPLEGLIYKYDIDSLEKYDCKEVVEDISVPNSIIPHRRIGRFDCLPHKDEGLVDGKWAKGKTTARNERRYVLEMQKGSWKYKEDGIKQVNYKLISTKEFTPWAKMLNVEL